MLFAHEALVDRLQLSLGKVLVVALARLRGFVGHAAKHEAADGDIPGERALRIAARRGVVARAVGHHDLSDLGRTYTLIDAAWTEKAVIEAIRKKKVQVATEPLTSGEMARILGRMAYTMLQRRLNL